MKRLWDFLFSTRLMALLFVVFAAAMAIATFIENDYGTPTARKLIYQARWFELIMLLFVLNFIGHIFRYRLWRRAKWPLLLFHAAFVLILTGAWVTRYISYEGIMPIYEGQASDHILSEKTYLTVQDDAGHDLIVKPLLLGRIGSNHFTARSTDGRVEVELLDYAPKARAVFKEVPGGTPHLHIVVSASGGRRDLYLEKNSIAREGEISISFGRKDSVDLAILPRGDSLFLRTKYSGRYMVMPDGASGVVPADTAVPLRLRTLYSLGSLQVVIPDSVRTGHVRWEAGPPRAAGDDRLLLRITAGDKSDTLAVFGRQYSTEGIRRIRLGGETYRLAYGARLIKLPFTVKLRDFRLERYPGSQSPKSYASEITVIDKEKNKTFDYRIYMNHVLDYRGYRFFQASYSISPRGEQTRLSVNHDAVGTAITYTGYMLLFAGLLLTLVWPGTRFSQVRRKLRALRQAASLISLLLLAAHMQAQDPETIPVDSFLAQMAPPKAHAARFGRLIVQDADGRMEPVNTFSSELLRKLSKHDTYHGYNSDQILLSMAVAPQVWYYAPILYIEKFDTGIRKLIGVPRDQKYARLIDLLNEDGSYKLRAYTEAATKQRIRNNFEKNILAFDQRANLLYGVLERGQGLRLFPAPGDPNQRWYSAREAGRVFHGTDSLFVTNVFPLYGRALLTGNDSLAVALLKGIGKFQAEYGGNLLPSERHVRLELLYNKYDIFRKLFSYYMMAGSLLFLLVIAGLFRDSKWLRALIRLNMAVIIVLFLLHTAGLGVRWYISGRAPWANAYESMIYVAWALMLFGIVLGRRSPLTMGTAAFLTSMILMIAHWNWMDPAIENLVPVLNSYWLMIHVSMIVASYGPFALSMILGVVALLFMVLTNAHNHDRLAAKIKEITYINELSMTLGLVLLTIGNFLGGMWANESWGRYWGWDPKETWALISIMVYAFILHMRLVPGLRGRYAFNLLSVIGFSSILMTYFGVNFYLAGLHSYAKGDPVPIPAWVYYAAGSITVLAIAAYIRYWKYYTEKQ